jgi:rSAM/selenodomain-associated transferase 1
LRSGNGERSPRTVEMNAPDTIRTSDVLAVMARYPIPGATKTRLAAVVGTQAAARLSHAFVLALEERLRSLPVEVRWFYSPADRDFAALLRRPAWCAPQAEGDLGARMRTVFEGLFAAGYQRVVMIGSDAPHIDLAVVRQAYEELALDRVVLGPSLDGGYYLIGLAKLHDVFTDIPWSTPAVLQRSRKKAQDLGLAVRLLPPTFDIDEADDLVRLRHELAEHAPDFLSATRDVLETISAA